MSIPETACVSSMINNLMSRNTQPRKHLEISSSATYPGFHEIMDAFTYLKVLSTTSMVFLFSKKSLHIFIQCTVCISSILLLPFKNLVRNEKYGSYEADMELPVQSQFAQFWKSGIIC